MSTPYTSSVATKALDSAVSGLDRASNVLSDLQRHSAQLVVVVGQLDTCLVDAVKCLDTLKGFLNLFDKMLTLMRRVGKYIPEIGQVVAQIALVIQKTQVEQTVRKAVDEMEKIIDKAQKGVMKNIRSASTTLSSKLTKTSEQIPDWKSVLNTLSALYKLIDMVVYVFFGATSDQMVKGALQRLTKSAEDVQEAFKLAEDSLAPLTQFMDSAMLALRSDVFATLKDEFTRTINKFSDISDIIRTVNSAMQEVESALAPLFAQLKILDFIYEHTIGLLQEFLMEKLQLNRLIKELGEKIQEAIGAADMKKQLEELFDKTLEPMVKEIEGFVKGTDLKSITGSFKNTADVIQGFRKDPAWQLYLLIEKGLLKNPHNCTPDGFCKFWDDDDTDNDANKHSLGQMKMTAFTMSAALITTDNSNSTRFDMHLPEISKRRPRGNRSLSALLDQRQKAMDDLVTSTWVLCVPSSQAGSPIIPSSDRSRPAGTMLFAVDASLPPVPPPSLPSPTQPASQWVKMDYAIFDDMPVSVLLRTTHAAFRASLASTASQSPVPRTLAAQATQEDLQISASSAFVNGDLHSDVRSFSSSPAFLQAVDASHPSPQADVTTVKSDLALLRTQLTTSLAAFDSLLSVGINFERDLSLLSTSTITFVDHQLALLQGLDPILSSITSSLALSNKYRSAFLGIGEVIPQNWIDWIFNIVTRVENAVGGFRKEADDVVKVTETFKVAFQDYHHSFDAAGLGFSTIIPPLQQRMKGALEGLSAIDKGLDALISCSPPPTEAEFQERLQAFQSAARSLRTLWSLAPNLVPTIEWLSKNLKPLHSDLTKFLSMTLAISQHSTILEKKLIATDLIRVQCQRLSTLFGVFETVLSQLGVKPDPNRPSPSDGAAKVSDGLQSVSLITGSQWLKDLVEQCIPDLVVDGLEVFLKQYFQMEGLSQELGKVGEDMGKRAGWVKRWVEGLRDDMQALDGVGKIKEVK